MPLGDPAPATTKQQFYEQTVSDFLPLLDIAQDQERALTAIECLKTCLETGNDDGAGVAYMCVKSRMHPRPERLIPPEPGDRHPGIRYLFTDAPLPCERRLLGIEA